MKNIIVTAFKLIAADRLVAVLLSVFLVGCAAYCLYVVLTLRPSDLQVAVHYSAFGNTHFYREKWYYLLSFLVFGVSMAVVHTTLVAKLYGQQRRSIVLAFVGFSFLTLVVAWVLTWSVLRIAAL
ncbi:MAG: hypothetical protein ABIR91_05065 [Candidatus Saccharimonadales bacterium]